MSEAQPACDAAVRKGERTTAHWTGLPGTAVAGIHDRHAPACARRPGRLPRTPRHLHGPDHRGPAKVFADHVELRPDSHNAEHQPIRLDLAKHILHMDGVAVGALIGRLSNEGQ